MKMLPELYQNHLRSQLSRADYLLFQILINLLQLIKNVSLESLATALPLHILFESKRKKIQRFLSLPCLKIETIWFPILSSWLSTQIHSLQVIHIAIDRTTWGRVNLLMISLVWNKRGIPIYFELLPKLGNSNFDEQQKVFLKVLPLFDSYKTVVLGDREFCSVILGNWLQSQKVYFCLRLKKDTFIKKENGIWQELDDLGLQPGISFYLQGIKITKFMKLEGFNIACKWKRKYRDAVQDEGWFILTNLETLEMAIESYKKRFSIEEMFRDFKSGGYNLEETNVSGNRLIVLILLLTIAYSSATFFGEKIKLLGVQKYVGRVKEFRRKERRHSSFYIGLHGQNWVNIMEECGQLAWELMRLNRNKRKYYQQGHRARMLILYAS
jgi:Transposase DDE domain